MNVLCMGETLLRYSTKKGHRMSELDFDIHIGGSETNIAVNLAQYGINTSLFTKLPEHAIGDAVIQFLRKYNVNTSFILRNSMRMGAYFLENGSGNRTSQVIYDRSFSAITSLKEDEVNLEEVFKDIDCFIVTGITVALNENVRNTVMKMLKYAKENNIFIIYDNNYRAKLWSTDECAVAFKQILPYVDLLSAGYLDAQVFLGLKSIYSDFELMLEDLYGQIKTLYPNIKYMTSTKRDIISTSVNELTGYVYSDRLYVSKTHHIDDIVDRVGGGDAYLSGLLYGLWNDYTLEDALEFGVCASVLKHTIHGDANLFSVQEIENYKNSGTSRINR